MTAKTLLRSVTRCSTCRADIVWAVTRSRKRIPLEAEPIVAGNIRVRHGKGALLAEVVGQMRDMFDDTDDGVRYESHFVRCPDASEHRR